MLGFLRDINIDSISFWLGFLAGSLFWLFLGIFSPQLRRLWASIKNQWRLFREGVTATVETRLRNEVLQHTQKLHLSASLFTFDEIQIPPRILAPPPIDKPGNPDFFDDITNEIIPYIPDWPELGTAYGVRTLTLTEALSKGSNLVLMGRPGSGKTSALVHLTGLIARRETRAIDLDDLIPFYIHIFDIRIDDKGLDDPASALINAISSYCSPATIRRLPNYFPSILTSGRALVMIDGMDEASRAQVDEMVNFIKLLSQQYPQIRSIVATSNQYYGRLSRLGYIPVSMAAWDRDQHSQFIQKWTDLWRRYVSDDLWPTGGEPDEDQPKVEFALIYGWLQNTPRFVTPLELTLKTWSAYAGDMLGEDIPLAIEAHLRRISVGISNARLVLNQLALQMTYTMNAAIPESQAGNWISKFTNQEATSETRQMVEGSTVAAKDSPIMVSPSRRIIDDLVSRGLLVKRADTLISFAHPVFLGYLAGNALGELGAEESILSQPNWTGKTLALQYMAAGYPSDAAIDAIIQKSEDPLHEETLMVAQWLPDSPVTAHWRASVLRQLVKILKNTGYPFSLRARVATAMALSGEEQVAMLFKQMLESETTSSRQLGALGLGLVKSNEAVDDLNALLYGYHINLQRTACSALAYIGTKEALDAIGSALLHGDESLRRYAAESLAIHPEEGHEILKEGAEIDDLLVRRAVVYALYRIRQEWSFDLLEKLQLEDEQWVVRNVATQAIEAANAPNPQIPRPRPELQNAPWLIAFAGERGLGVSPGKPAMDLLVRALNEGSVEVQMAALDHLSLYPDPSTVHQLYDILFSSAGELQDATLYALWLMNRSDIQLPTPKKFGLGFA